jgi:hypothetical protein
MIVFIIILERPRMQAKLPIFRDSFIALHSIFCFVIPVHSLLFSASSAQFRKGPYLFLEGSNNSMTVAWQTTQTPAGSLVEWGYSPNSFAQTSGNLPEKGDHKFFYTISGLLPSSMVYYRVTVDGNAETGSFMSPPSPFHTIADFLWLWRH